MTEEQNELMRIAAQRLLDDVACGRRRDADAVRWARRIVARIKPLGRPVSPGELPPVLRDGLEVF